MKIVQRVLCRREKVVSMLENLEALRGRGDIEGEQYDRLRAEYDALHKETEANVEAIRSYLRQKEQQLRDQRRQLQEEMEQLTLRQKVGEVTAVQAERSKRKLEGQLTATDRKIMRVETALSAQTSSDVGGYIDVEVHARVEPGAGVLGDELEAPEIVGAAQESIKEWQGRAHEAMASARVRGREWLDRKEVVSARSTLWSLGERALGRVDAAAEHATEAINRHLEKYGRPRISAGAVKVAVAVVLLVLFLFVLTRDSYPSTPAKVLKATWNAANAGDVANLEQYLSLMSLGWIDEALAMMPGKDMESLLREKWDQRTRHQTMDTLEIVQEDTKDTRASVKYVVHYQDGRSSAPRVETFVLESGQWKIESRMSDLF